jgi:peptide deformylase
MILPIYLYGWPLLRRVSEDIPPDSPWLKDLIANMFETMYHSDGVGLAAPQIGKSIRLIVIDGRSLAEDDPSMSDFVKVLINPHISERGTDTALVSEGCLSLPGIREEVRRPDWVQMSYYDEHLVFHDDRFEGYAARIVQHEYDHLEGKLFIDHISPIRRKLLTGKLNQMIRGNVSADYKFVSVKK